MSWSSTLNFHTSTLVSLLRHSTLSRNSFLLKVCLINFSSFLVSTLMWKRVAKRKYPLEFCSTGLLELEKQPSLKY